jgi:hypothetical protein
MHEIVPQAEPRAFTLHEAQALFPLVRTITEAAFHELEPVRRELETMLPHHPRIHQIEDHYEAIVKRWVGKMERLGLIVKGLWLVDFDTGDGYLCWKFPERRLNHYHGYAEGYAHRRPLRDVIEEIDPDWAVS